jgi:glycosyltransferase involved in cell wall biosynthesis
MSCRLLYLVGQLDSGGLQRQLYYLLQKMDRERYCPELFVWNMRDDDIYVPHFRRLGIPLHALPNGLSRTEKLFAFRRIVKQIKPEVIHSYTFHTNFAAWWATFGTKTIPVGSSRSDLIFDRKNTGPLLGRLSARWPRFQISNNLSAVKRAREEKAFFVPERFSVIRNAVDCQSFRMRPFPTGSPLTICGVGSLIPVKRWDRLLAAASELKRKNLNFLIQIAGDGPLRCSLQLQATELGVADQVRFIGHIDDVPELLAKSAFSVHTSDLEGCPNAVMEAMACGRAVVAMNAGDIPELVDDGSTGFIVPREDHLTLVNRLSQLITDHHLCRSMGEAGRAKAEREFRIDRFVSKTLAAYEAAGRRND